MADDFADSVNRSADGIIRTHGNHAEAHARSTVVQMAARKDVYGERMWQAIVRAIEEKQSPKL